MAQGERWVISWVTKAFWPGTRVAKRESLIIKCTFLGQFLWVFNVYSFVSQPETDCWVEQLPFLFPNKAQVFLKKVYNSVIFS